MAPPAEGGRRRRPSPRRLLPWGTLVLLLFSFPGVPIRSAGPAPRLHPADETDNHTWLSLRPDGRVLLRWLLRVRKTRAMDLRDRIDADGDMEYTKEEIDRTAREVARAAIPLLDLYVDGLPLKLKLLGARLWGDGKDGLYDENNEILLEARFQAAFPARPGIHLLVYRDRNYPARILPGRMHQGDWKGVRILKANWDAYPPFVGARIRFRILPGERPSSRPGKEKARTRPASRPASRPARRERGSATTESRRPGSAPAGGG